MASGRPPVRLPVHGAATIVLAVGAWLLVAAIVAVAVWRERVREIDQARAAAAATTALLAAHTSNTFQVVDVTLQEVARRLEAPHLPRHDPALQAWMRQRLPEMPYVRALFVVGPDGFVQHDTDHPNTPDVSLADRAYFRAHRENPALERSISEPLQSRSGLGWFVAVTRRLGDGRHFRGVAVAAIQLRYFSELYERMGLGPGHQIALFDLDGRLIAQHPHDAGVVGQIYADSPLFRSLLAQRSRGVFVTTAPPLAYQRISSYEAVRNQPLVVALAYDMNVVLAPWRRTALASAAGLGVLFVLLAAAVGLLLRDQLRRQQARERLAQGEKMEALGQLTGGIAHDFGNVLGILASNLELLRRGTLGDASAGVAVARAQRAVDTGTALTRQLLAFARKRELRVEALDLQAELAAVLPLLQQAAGAGVDVVLEAASGLPPCRADRAQLEVALVNLVVNARDAMQRRGRVVLRTALAPARGRRHWWRREAGPPCVLLTVQDDGPGMSEQVRRHALEPFFTTKGEAGTGLGLAQVYGLMQQLGGELAIESEAGRGTAVHLTFPAAEEEDA